MNQYLECAKITTTHGVRGGVRLECRCDSPAVLAALKRMYYPNTKTGAWNTLNVLHASVQKQMVVATFREISTLEEAIPLRDTVLYADRRDIPREEGTHFIADLLGLPILDADSGEEIGKLAEVLCPAGQDIYVIRRPDGSSFMMPAVPAFIAEIPTDGDGIPTAVCVHLIDGMME